MLIQAEFTILATVEIYPLKNEKITLENSKFLLIDRIRTMCLLNEKAMGGMLRVYTYKEKDIKFLRFGDEILDKSNH